MVENMLSKDNYISKNQRPIARTRNKVCSPDLTKNETSMKCEIAAVFRVRIVIILTALQMPAAFRIPKCRRFTPSQIFNFLFDQIELKAPVLSFHTVVIA